jgi:hypothetical protein
MKHIHLLLIFMLHTVYSNAQSLKLLSPNGGESINSCVASKILWTQQGVSNTITIDYSIDGGNNWINYTSKYNGKDGKDSIDWNAPNISSTKTRIRLRDANNFQVKDSSKANFTIVPDLTTSLTITSPNGGESFSPSSLHPITWTTNGSVGNVSIQYSVNGGATWNWAYDVNGTASNYVANTGSFNWIVPGNLGISSTCLVRVYEYYKNCMLDYSDAFFNIDNNPNITITAPVANDTWYIGRAYYISWSSFNIPGNYVTIDYSSDNGTNWKTIVDSTYNYTNGTSYNWVIPNTLTTQGILRVSATRNKAIKNLVSFKIAAPFLTLLSPNGGESINSCVASKILWTQQGVSNTIMIDYSIDGGNNWINYTSKYNGKDGNDSIDWNAPNISSTKTRIRLRDANNFQAKDSSDANFTIVPDLTTNLTITSPNGGESFSPSSLHVITWTTKGSVGNVSIQYSVNGGTTWNWVYDANGNAANYIANTGSVSWLVPANLAVSSTCLVRIYEYYKNCMMDYSDAFFSIDNNPNISVTVPAANDTWYAGRSYYIGWSSFNIPGNYVTIEYSIDNGASWKIIVDSTYNYTNGTSYNWIVPNTPTTQGIMRVSATRNKTLKSEVSFKIATAVLTLLSPNGGESINACVASKILWTQQGVSNSVIIDYSIDGGNNWINYTIKYNGKDGKDSMDWNAPNTSITKARIRLRDGNNVQAKDSSKTNFTIVPDATTSLTITSPNGGESFSPSSLHAITWTTKGTVGNVSIQYSVNGGATWNWVYDQNGSAANYIANTGSFTWFVPASLGVSSSCLIKIYEYYKNCMMDYSDAFFSIDNTPNITITAPVANDTWYTGRAYYISWSSFNIPGNYVTIDYSSDNGASWKSIVDSTYNYTNGTSYNWTVPNTPTTQGIIRVSATRNKTIKSEVSFKIATPALTLLSPNGGETINACAASKILWNQQGVSNAITIDYSIDGGNNWINYTSKYNGKDGKDSIDWNAPNISSTKTRIRLRDANNFQAKDSSDANFTIVPDLTTNLTITSPNGGESFSPNALHPITWTTKGSVGNVSIQYSINGGTTWSWLYDVSGTASNYLANTGSFNWIVPGNLSVSSKCLVRIYEYYKNCMLDYSDAFFSIDNNSNISITAPTANNTLFTGKSYYISWTSFNIPGNYVTLDYSVDNGASWKTIVDSTYSYANGTSYNWTVPNTPTTQGILRVSATRNKTIKDQMNFKIATPLLTILTPNGGENWRQGEVKNISWKTEGLETTSNLKIEFSTNNGKKWNTLVASYKNSGSYLWTIADSIPSSSTCFVKVSSLDFSTCKDSNDLAFSIIKPVVGVIVPNNGETWYVGESKSIQWNSLGGSGNVKIELSTDKGSTWNNVIASTPNTGFYYWTIPSATPPSATCLIKISDEVNPLIKDSSDVVFTIAKPKIKLTTPDGNEIWYAGQKQIINWINTGKQSPQVKLEISTDNGVNWQLINSAADNNGSFAWLVPVTFPASDQCLVKITDLADASITDVSNAVFALKKSAIYITSPNGGETWYMGQTKNISWKNLGAAATNVKIEYSTDNGSSWKTIIASVANTGLFSWAIPTSIPISTNYLIRVSDVSDNTVSDISDNLFAIKNTRIGDEFISPIVIPSFPYTTTDTSSLYSDGYTGTNNQSSSDVFYKFKVPACTDSVFFSTVGSGFDTYLHLLDSTQTLIESNDNANGYFAEIATKKMSPGKTYYLVVEGYQSNSGIYRLNIRTYNGEPKITVSNQLTTICQGDSVKLATAHASSYLWSTGSTQQQISVKPSVTTTYAVVVMTPRGCVFSDSIKINVIPAAAPSVVNNMLPVNGALDLSLPVHFSWAPAINASEYDLYIWPFGTARPVNPLIANTNKISFDYNSMIHGGKYNWQLVAKNSCFKTESGLQTFTIEELPDLAISNFKIPASIASGTLLEVAWQVKNVGKGSTKSATWYDKIFLSLDTIAGNADDIILQQVPNLSYLQVGQIYSQKQQIKLAPSLIGQYFIYASTGINLQESTKNNNTTFDTLQIYASPVPDLKVTSVGAPTAAFGGTKINITYNVKNEGNYFAEKNWTDEIFISKDSIFNQTSATLLSSILITDNLSKDSSYTKTVSATIPHSFVGTYYIYAFADSRKTVFEYVFEDNNILGAEFPIVITLRPPADLQVASVTVPSTVSEKTMDIKWEVGNEGGNPPIENSWSDRIYLSKLSTFNADSALLIGDKIHGQGADLTPGTSYTVAVQATLPDGLQGDYYVYVYTDAKKEVFEYTYDDNNIKRSNKTVKIIAAPVPDLIVTTVTIAADTLVAGDSAVVNWTIKNAGAGAVSKNWNDRIYVSKEQNWDVTKATLIGTVNRLSPLDTGKIYTQNIKLKLPYGLSGLYYFYIQTDAFNHVYENTNENNNIGKNNKTVFIRPSSSDLFVSVIEAPATAFTGQSLAISWTVKNVGENTTSSNYWSDEVFISTDATLDNSDVFLKREARQAGLEPGASYSQTINYQLKGLVGNYYIIVRSDADKSVSNDTVRVNNINQKAIAITLLPPPDLAVEKITIGTTMYAGQQLPMGFTIKNQGTGIATGNWYEGVYISSTPSLDYGAIKVGIYERKTALAAGSNYSDSTVITIPSYLSGNYYLLVRADNNDQVYEHLKEDNNIQSIPINITTPLPSDLIVSRMSVPDSVVLGENASMSYTIKNIGINTAIGTLKDALHVSTDNLFNGASDPLFSVQSKYIYIKPGDSVTSTVNGPLPGVLPATYYGIGRTNTLNSVVEADYTNNEKASDKNFAVIIPALQLDIPKDSIALDYEKRIYYKVDVGADLDLLITLTSNQLQGSNEVYVSYNKIPTASDYEFKYTNAADVNQQVFVPRTKSGTYYILLRCLNNFNNTQRVTLLAKALPFSILSINPKVVGQGTVTCTLNGAGFRDSTVVVLKNKSGVIVDTAEIRKMINSMQLKVRWHLDSVPLGKYDVWAINNNGASVLLADGLTVEPARKMELGIFGNNPSVVRAGRPALYSYVFENISNVDISYIEIYYQFPEYADVEITSETGFKRKYVEDDFNDAKKITFFAKDIPPSGGNLSANFKLANFKYSSFPITASYEIFTVKEYISKNVKAIEGLRKRLINSSATTIQPVLLNLANDSIAFRDSLLFFMSTADLLDAKDIKNVNYQNLASNYKEKRMIQTYAAVTPTFKPIPPGCKVDEWNTCFKDEFDRCVRKRGYVCDFLFGGGGALCVLLTSPGVILPAFCIVVFGADLLLCKDQAEVDCELEWREYCVKVVKSCDPNDIIGPRGYDTGRWIASKSTLPYTINFENDSTFATAPVQRVKVTQKLNDHLNPFSFRLGDFGFGSHTFKVPANTNNYHTVLDTKDSLGVNVEVTAGLDIVKKEVFWILQSIDPATGAAPYDPFKGFLPINDYTGKGKGFVNYTIQPKTNSITRDTVLAMADIVFDINEPIKTPTIFNTIDAFPPTSVMNPLPPTVADTAVTITWKAQDDAGGCGIESYALYVSKDKGGFYKYRDQLKDTVFVFGGNPGSYYEFYVLAKDYVGNEEVGKTEAEASTTFGNVNVKILNPIAGSKLCAGDSLQIQWKLVGDNKPIIDAVNSYKIEFSSDSAITFKTIAEIQTSVYLYTWLIPGNLPGSENCFIRISLNGVKTTMSGRFTIAAKPVVTFTPFSKPVCINAASFVLNTAVPTGGTYSGKGVNAGYFNPSIAGLGKHTLTYTYKDTISGCVNSASQEIVVDVCTFIDPNEQASWNIYPNPTLDVIHIDHFAGSTTSLSVRLINGAGQTVYSDVYEHYKGKYNKSINLSKERAGVYILQIITDKETFTQKIIKN